MQETEYINVYGARVHNLKDIDAEIPRNSLTVITGLSGSGKSSLAFDTIFAEGQRRYIETFSGSIPESVLRCISPFPHRTNTNKLLRHGHIADGGSHRSQSSYPP